MPVKSCRYCEALSSLNNKESVVEYRNDVLYIGGVKPTDPQIEEMAKECILLGRMNVWKVLSETIKAQALDLGIRHAKDFDQLMFAKAMLHVVEVQESIIKAIVTENAGRKKANVIQ